MAKLLCATDALGRTPLMLAVRTEKHEAMKWLLQQGAPIDKGNTQNGWSPLLLASWKADVVAMEILIAHGADVDSHCEGESGFTPLVAAAARSARNACQILLAAGASVQKAEHVLKCSTNSLKNYIIKFIRDVSSRPWSIVRVKSCPVFAVAPSRAEEKLTQ
jgi:ankyrin repeat protein